MARGFLAVLGLVSCLCLPGWSGWQALAAPLKDRVFTIANYPVEARAKDAVAAKEMAHSDGQTAALGALFKRLVPVTAYSRLKQLTGANAAALIDGVAVRTERNSSTAYFANLDFSFQPQAVRDLLSAQGIPFVDEAAPKVTLVPVILQDGKFRPADAAWNGAWRGLDLENTLSPLKVEALLPILQPSNLKAWMAGDAQAASTVKGEYKASYVVFAVAEVDLPGRRVNVTIQGEDAAGTFEWKHAYRLQDGDVRYVMDLAAVVSLGVLEGRWKAAKVAGRGEAEAVGGAPQPMADGSGEVSIEVQFANDEEWRDMRTAILDLPTASDIRVANVTDQSATISVRFPGGAVALADALTTKGLSLSQGFAGWTLRRAF